MEHGNLLEEALGLDQALGGQVVVIEDSVETTASFLLHHFIKRILNSSNNIIIFLAFSFPFSHYHRILRKLGCNLVAQRDTSRFFFFDMLTPQCPGGNEEQTGEGGLIALFGKIQKIISTIPENCKNHVTIMIDDVSLMEVAACGSSDHVLDFLHYCHTLTSDFGCSMVMLNHEDIYSSMERPILILQMEYLADVLIKAEPLASGLAADVHGQLTVLNKGISSGKGNLKSKITNFQFMVKENGVEYFYPGSRS